MRDESAPGPVDEAVLEDLRSRLRSTRRVPGIDGGWTRGTDPAYLDELIATWRDDFDWRPAERRLLALPWVRADSGIRAVYQRASDPSAPTVVLLHGWPDSFLRFTRVLPLLTDVHVVVPCLPGYPYAGAQAWSRDRMAVPIAAALAELGVDRYVVSGGDIGAGVAERLARIAPDHVSALHLTDIPLAHATTVPAAERTEDEEAFASAVAAWRTAEGSYSAQQGTKPNTLSAALGDSPVGLAAWIVEKARSWSDCHGDVESVFPRHDLLTWLTLYWVTASIGTSFGPYALREPPERDRVETPTAVTQFAGDIATAPRSVAERVFDVRVWDVQQTGGHFAAWERPEAFATALRSAIALAG